MIEEKGNIVAEYQFKNGRVLVSDGAYAGKTEQELENVRREARRIAWNIAIRHEAQKRAGKETTYE